MSTLCPSRPSVPTVEMTVSWPLKASVTDSTDDRSAERTVTPSGKVAEEDSRLTTVTLNLPDLMSALSTASPRDPEAYCGGEIQCLVIPLRIVRSSGMSQTYPNMCNVFDRRHFAKNLKTETF